MKQPTGHELDSTVLDDQSCVGPTIGQFKRMELCVVQVLLHQSSMDVPVKPLEHKIVCVNY